MAKPQQGRARVVRVAASDSSRTVLQNAAAVAVAMGLALAPVPALAVLPAGVESPGQTELDELLASKLEKIRASGIGNESPSEGQLKAQGAAVAPAVDAEPAAPVQERADIRQAAIEAAETAPLQGGRPVAATKAAPVRARAAAPAGAGDAAAPNTAALAGVVVVAVGAVAAAAATNKGEGQEGSGAPAAGAPASGDSPAAPLAADAAPEPTNPGAGSAPAPAGK